MKKYKILRTVTGVRQGELHPFLFEQDSEHHIDDDLATQLFDQGAIEMVEDETERKPEEKTEEKDRGAAPSNKNRGAAPSNKSKQAE